MSFYSSTIFGFAGVRDEILATTSVSGSFVRILYLNFTFGFSDEFSYDIRFCQLGGSNQSETAPQSWMLFDVSNE